MVIPNARPWTYENYALLPEDGKRHEIIDGEHYVTPAPTVRHQRIVRQLILSLAAGAAAQRTGEVLSAPCDVLLTETDIVQPDVLFISGNRSHIVTEENVQGAPDLVVEVLSESTRKRDERLKRDLYERFGVREYWVVDPDLETVKIYRQAEDSGFGPSKILEHDKGALLETPLLPGLELPLATLFGAS